MTLIFASCLNDVNYHPLNKPKAKLCKIAMMKLTIFFNENKLKQIVPSRAMKAFIRKKRTRVQISTNKANNFDT